MQNVKIKILFINDTYHDSGGAEVYFFNLIDHFSKNKKYDVYSMGFAPKEKFSEKVFIYKDAKSKISRYFQRIFGNPFLYKKLRKWIVKISPDIIHLNNINKATESLLKACRDYRTVQTVHDYGLVCPSLWCVYKDNLKVCSGKIGNQCIKHKCIPSRYYPFLLRHNKSRNRLLKNQVSVFITAGKILQNYLLSNNFKNIEVITLPIELKNKTAGNKLEKGTILFVGALEENKGIINLIDCYEKIYLKNQNTKLMIIGKGSLEKSLKEKAKSLKSKKNIIFFGKVPHQEINKYYQKANVVVVPSILQETFSLVTAEAMATGCPVVASNRGEVVNLVKNGESGFIVDPINTKKMEYAILRIIDDNKLYRSMSIASIKRAKILFSTNHFQKIENIYQKLIN